MERRRPIHVSQRLAVFVDVQNMFYSARALYQRKLNFQQLAENASKIGTLNVSPELMASLTAARNAD